MSESFHLGKSNVKTKAQTKDCFSKFKNWKENRYLVMVSTVLGVDWVQWSESHLRGLIQGQLVGGWGWSYLSGPLTRGLAARTWFLPAGKLGSKNRHPKRTRQKFHHLSKHTLRSLRASFLLYISTYPAAEGQNRGMSVSHCDCVGNAPSYSPQTCLSLQELP